ncbi:hypothetical protein EC988_009443, partial [Linderina pennispora]
MSAADIATEFASVVESGPGSDNRDESQAQQFKKLTQKYFEVLEGDTDNTEDPLRKGRARYWKVESNTWDLMERLSTIRQRAQQSAADQDANMVDDTMVAAESIATTDFVRVQD